MSRLAHKRDVKVLVGILIVFLTVVGLIGLDLYNKETSTVVPATTKDVEQSDPDIAAAEADIEEFDETDSDFDDIESIDEDLDPGNF